MKTVNSKIGGSQMKTKSVAVAIIANVLLPGAGHCFLGRPILGLFMFILTTFLCLTVGLIAFAPVWVFMQLVMAVDAILINNKRQQDAVKVAMRSTKKCPQCAELIQKEAKVCRYCGNQFEPTVTKPEGVDPRITALREKIKESKKGGTPMKSVINMLICMVALMCAVLFAAGCGDSTNPGNSQCIPKCDNRICGTDSICNESCGECAINEICQNGSCYLKDPCKDSCVVGELCTVSGTCIANCTPNCTGLICGPDPVCKVSCGECGTNMGCYHDQTKCISGTETIIAPFEDGADVELIANMALVDAYINGQINSIVNKIRQEMSSDLGIDLTGLLELPNSIPQYTKIFDIMVATDIDLADLFENDVVYKNTIITSYFKANKVKSITVNRAYAIITDFMNYPLETPIIYIANYGTKAIDDPTNCILYVFPTNPTIMYLYPKYIQQIQLKQTETDNLNSLLKQKKFTLMLHTNFTFDSNLSRRLPQASAGSRIGIALSMAFEVYPLY